MNPLKIREHLRATPFVPFRLFLDDGSFFDVPHPEFAMLTALQLHVAIPEGDEGGDEIPIQSAYLAPEHISRIEPLKSAQTA